MEGSPVNDQLNKYWGLLSADQKKSLAEFITLLNLTDEKGNQVLNEPDQAYRLEYPGFPLEILQKLTIDQKKALIALIEAFGIDTDSGRISLEQYNKEIDEAMAAIDRGDFYTHDQVIEMSKTWLKDDK